MTAVHMKEEERAEDSAPASSDDEDDTEDGTARDCEDTPRGRKRTLVWVDDETLVAIDDGDDAAAAEDPSLPPLERVDAARAHVHSGWAHLRHMHSCTELWCHNIKEVDCLAARRPHEKQSGDYYVPIFGRLFGARRRCQY